MPAKNEYILEVKNLKKYFKISLGTVRAVDDISFNVRYGETFGLVGESGSGKSTTGHVIVGMYSPTSGKIVFKGHDISVPAAKRPKHIKREIQIVFQDPMSSLNPRMTVGQMLSEPLLFHGIVKTREEANKVIAELLKAVGLKPHHIDRYPHQFSGGQRQRLAIARAISVKYLRLTEYIFESATVQSIL